METLQQLQLGTALRREGPQYASMTEVVMKKSELLDKLIENKAKHDVILATAISGYWETAKDKLEIKRKQLLDLVQEFTHDANHEINKVSAKVDQKQTLPRSISIRSLSVDASLDLVYPEDHSRDYDKAIRMMQSSIFDEVKLTDGEYDAYVLNNWEWKRNFLASNSFYVDTIKSRHGKMMMCSGYAGPVGASGPAGNPSGYESTYNEAATKAASGLYASLNNF